MVGRGSELLQDTHSPDPLKTKRKSTVCNGAALNAAVCGVDPKKIFVGCQFSRPEAFVMTWMPVKDQHGIKSKKAGLLLSEAGGCTTAIRLLKRQPSLRLHQRLSSRPDASSC